MPDIKELFKQFAFAYIAASHTQTDESEAELKRLIAEWCDGLNDEECFNRYTMWGILEYVEHNISDENKGLYHYFLSDSNYSNLLEKYIKYIVNLYNKNN